MTLGDTQERSWSTVARPIPGTAPLTVSHGGNNHPIFESAAVAETKWLVLFGEDCKAIGIPTTSDRTPSLGRPDG